MTALFVINKDDDDDDEYNNNEVDGGWDYHEYLLVLCDVNLVVIFGDSDFVTTTSIATTTTIAKPS